MTKGEAEELGKLQSEWGRSHSVEVLAAMYGALRSSAAAYVEKDHAHEAAAKIVQRYLSSDGFHIRNFPVYLSRTARNLEAERHRRGRSDTASPETFDQVADGRDYRKAEPSLEEDLADLGAHPQGAEIIVTIRRARSRRGAILALEAIGLTRPWLRDNARAVLAVWRGYHG